MPKKTEIGRALVNLVRKPKPRSKRHTAMPASVVDQPDLEEYMAIVSLSHKQFIAERGSDTNTDVRIVKAGDKALAFEHFGDTPQPLRLPRRPKWTSEMTGEELQEAENKAFLDWRRELATQEEAKRTNSVTPFEKNVDIWRQLWKVLELSDVVVQIVDCRNPLFYRSEDLEKYTAEISSEKRMVLLLNKADYLSEQQRLEWSDFFTAQQLEHYFYSAKAEIDMIDRGKQRRVQFGREFREVSPGYIYSALELISRLTSRSQDKTMIGFIGYPNVGKSTIINSICGRKRVGVAEQPGKTKHFQTLILTDKVTLCDCPGLVFPSFVSSRAEMVVSGVLSIDHLTDYLSPVELVCRRVHSTELEAKYGVKLGGRVPATILLQKIANERGFYAGGGRPSEEPAARIVLKDFVSGHLLAVRRPPSMEDELEPVAPPEVVDTIDAEFFRPPKVLHIENTGSGITVSADFKITKDDKRRLKFAARRGENLETVLKQMAKEKGGGPVKVMGRKG
jgi:large subunit GTPase 1